MLLSIMVVILMYFILFSSFHSLTFLLTMEFMVMVCLFIILQSESSWSTGVSFLLVGVCLSAYGVCTYVSLVQSKGYLYFFSF